MKKFIAKQCGLYTEEDLHLAIYDKCKELRRILNDDYHNKTNKLTQKAIELLEYYNPLDYRFLAIFPFASKKNIFYWVIAKIPQSNRENYYPRCTLKVKNSTFSSDTAAYLYFKINNTKAIIEDVVVSNTREGIGSYLLRLLEQLVSHFGVKEIVGWLSPYDFNNRPAQIAFYNNNGYVVTLSDNKETGGIKKVIAGER